MTNTLHKDLLVLYEIDTRASRMMVRAFASGFLSAFGHDPSISVRELRGQAQMPDQNLDGASLRAAIPAASLRVENGMSDKDRKEMQRAMDEEVLEVNRYSEITYECSRISGNISGEGQIAFVLEGELTLHGVTRNEAISGRAFITGGMLRASGEFGLRMSDYQIKPVSAAGGGLKLKDELKITFDVVARKQA